MGRTARDGGLYPWWIYDGAEINRYVLLVDGSEEARRLGWLIGQRKLYPLVLGQANQEELVTELAPSWLGESWPEATPKLSPWSASSENA